MIGGVYAATVYVNDPERALAWYTSVLGMEKRIDAPFPEGRWLEVAAPGAPTVLVLAHGFGGWAPEKVGGFTGITLWCDDLDATYEALRGRGVAFGMPPTRFDWGANATFRDPDGNEFVLSGR